ncbi:hypothetical protein J1P26_20890 [Neobacillus sp. MM2021_6]|uniref:hypothetical protein n=1 Tax=Bacillaceae TaxID=186817 RepID=UPI00140C98C8|nr:MULTISPECIES: hypothetical protein [Bacillaceae]MBO0962168.1 hypothetical protein [Neobacillus sp. MM2021_6]NHC21059.1 hypothetical protein [Bacillus sp. MM2020_4]
MKFTIRIFFRENFHSSLFERELKKSLEEISVSVTSINFNQFEEKNIHNKRNIIEINVEVKGDFIDYRTVFGCVFLVVDELSLKLSGLDINE